MQKYNQEKRNERVSWTSPNLEDETWSSWDRGWPPTIPVDDGEERRAWCPNSTLQGRKEHHLKASITHQKRKHEKQPNTRLTKQNNKTRKSPCKPCVQSISWCPNIFIASIAMDLQRWYKFRANTREAMVSHDGVCKECKKCYSNPQKKFCKSFPCTWSIKIFYKACKLL